MQKHGLKRIFKAFVFSKQGLQVMWREESFRQEVIIGAVGIAVLIAISAPIDIILVFSALLCGVFVVEILNTALEIVADKIDSSINTFTRDVKDLGSAAVLVMTLITGGYFIYGIYKTLDVSQWLIR